MSTHRTAIALSLPLVPPGLEVLTTEPGRVLQVTPAIEAARDRALERVAAANQGEAGTAFVDRARAHILRELEQHGPASGEALVVACRAAGVAPLTDDRAFGPVFRRLLNARLIEQIDTCKRARGHGSAGGRIYRRTSTPTPQP